MHFPKFLTGAIALLTALWVTSASAQNLPKPTGRVVLTISGNIANTNVGDTAQFDLDMLQQLPSSSFRTSTEWTERGQVFEWTGVSLAMLMRVVGANGNWITARPVNSTEGDPTGDFKVFVPSADWVDGGPIIAYAQNGEVVKSSEMYRTSLLPFLMYEYDRYSGSNLEMAYERSVYQVDKLRVSN